MANTYLPSLRIVGEGAHNTRDPDPMGLGLGRDLSQEGRHATPFPPLIQALGEAEPPASLLSGTALAKGTILGTADTFFPCSLTSGPGVKTFDFQSTLCLWIFLFLSLGFPICERWVVTSSPIASGAVGL